MAFGNHIFKKLIVEIRHRYNLAHGDKAQAAFNDLNFDYNNVQITEGAGRPIALINSQKFIRLFADWGKYGIVLENIENAEDVKELVKKYLGSLPQKLGVGKQTRIGVRSIYLIPYEGTWEELVELSLNKFGHGSKMIEEFGKIKDTFYGFTLSDDKYTTNLSVAPLSKSEIKEKISEFKEFSDDFEQGMMQDIDLFSTKVENQKAIPFIEDAIDAARIRFLKYSEMLKG